jgi:hypothetical protein
MGWKRAKDWVVTIATAVLGLSLALDLVSWPAFAMEGHCCGGEQPLDSRCNNKRLRFVGIATLRCSERCASGLWNS